MIRFRRKHCILIAAVGWIASTSALIGLRIGRPVYYSDGNQTFAAHQLLHAGMLRWGPLEPEFALPGPVRGRVAQLADGKLLYGRVASPRRTELVLFDPGFPTRAPEPVSALASAGHDLAPTVTGDTVWFASDRPDGAGGFDLYRARYQNGGFSGVAPLDLPGVNTAFDETDPAPDPEHQRLVFVRRDPGLLEGQNATLWIASLGGSFATRVLLPTGERGLPPLDRDPTFTPHGKALYFLRQHPLEQPVLMQTFPHRGEWVKPLPVEIQTHTTTLRGPALLGHGFDLRLVLAGTDAEAMTYRSRAREVRPYWDGQAWIESLLVSLALFFLTLLVLLTLGARWHHLDLITKLFLISVAIHLLLLLWLSRMEIVRSFLPDAPEPGELEVTILAASHGDRSPGNEELTAQVENLSRQSRFQQEESALEAAAPGVELHRAQEHSRSLAAPARAELRPVLKQQEHHVVEPPAAVATRTGRSQEIVVSPTGLAQAKPDPRQAPARRQAAREGREIQVTTPGSDIGSTARTTADTKGLALRTPLPRRRSQDPEMNAIQDAPSLPRALRGGTAQAQAKADITPLVGKTTRSAPPVSRRPESAAEPGEEARPSGSLMARPDRQASLPAATGREDAPEPREIEAGTVALADSLKTNTKRVAAKAPRDPVPGSTLGAVAQAAPGLTGPAPRPDAGRTQPVAPIGSPSSFLGREQTGRSPGPLSSHPDLPDRGGPDPLADLRDLPARAPQGPGSRSAQATAPLAATSLEKLGPVGAAPTPERHHPRRGPTVTGGLRIPGSFLERATRRPELAGSASGLAALDAGLFQNRFGAQKEAALRKYGGGEDTERAVRLGLDYLARIQNRDGSWGTRSKHHKYGRVQVGKTALCVLAFLGAGHTHKSKTRHEKVVRKALEFLLGAQDDATGHFGATSTYSHGIATYALAECCAMTKDKALVEPLEYAVTWILVNQNFSKDRRNRGGWGYFSPTLKPEDSYARASTTAWQVMALKSAQLSGVKVAGEHLRLAEQFLWRCYDRRNRYFLYTHKPSRLRSSWRTLPASTPASCFCLLLLGNDAADNRLEAGLEYTVERRPRRYARHSNDDFVQRGAGNVYFWYYGSLAAFLAGGDSWRQWNRALKEVLLKGQSEDGSFQPIDVYAEYAGDSERDRSYTTAMCVLSLEVYYRYFTPLLRGR